MVTATGPVLAYLAVTPSLSSITTAQPLEVTIWVRTAVVGGTLATGTVTLSSGNYTSAATMLTNAIAQITIPGGTLAAGIDTLQAVYTNGNFPGSSGQASVTVTEVAPGPSFVITGTAVTIKAGATTGNTSTITVTPAGGFTGTVALTAAVTASPVGTVVPPTISFGATSPVSITGTATGTAMLTITTTATEGPCTSSIQVQRKFPWYAGGAALACLCLVRIPVR